MIFDLIYNSGAKSLCYKFLLAITRIFSCTKLISSFPHYEIIVFVQRKIYSLFILSIGQSPKIMV